MSKNEKYFLNSSHAALSSFQSSGRITRDIQFSPQLGLHPNFAPFHSAKLRISLTLSSIKFEFLLSFLEKKKQKIGGSLGLSDIFTRNIVAQYSIFIEEGSFLIQVLSIV